MMTRSDGPVLVATAVAAVAVVDGGGVGVAGLAGGRLQCRIAYASWTDVELAVVVAAVAGGDGTREVRAFVVVVAIVAVALVGTRRLDSPWR